MNKWVAVYCRISSSKINASDKTDINNSIENQKRIIERYIEEMYVEDKIIGDIEMYVDMGYSGTNLYRPALIRLLHDVEKDRISRIIAKDISRISRNYLELDKIIKKCMEHKVELITVLEGNYTFNVGIMKNRVDRYKDSGKIYIENDMYKEIRALLADFYSKDISIKTKSVIDMKKKNGDYKLPRLPFGYSMENDMIICLDDEKKIVQRIFYLYQGNKSIRQICNILDEEGILTPNEFYTLRCGNNREYKYTHKKKWNYTTVRKILSNEFYIGTLVCNKTMRLVWDSPKRVSTHNYIRVENHHESIIEKEEFYKIQYQLNNRSGNNR